VRQIGSPGEEPKKIAPRRALWKQEISAETATGNRLRGKAFGAEPRPQFTKPQRAPKLWAPVWIGSPGTYPVT